MVVGDAVVGGAAGAGRVGGGAVVTTIRGGLVTGGGTRVVWVTTGAATRSSMSTARLLRRFGSWTCLGTSTAATLYSCRRPSAACWRTNPVSVKVIAPPARRSTVVRRRPTPARWSQPPPRITVQVQCTRSSVAGGLSHTTAEQTPSGPVFLTRSV